MRKITKRSEYPQPIASILKDMMAPFDVQRMNIGFQINKALKQFDDPKIQKYVRMGSFKDGTLTLMVQEPAHNQYVSFKQWELMMFLNDYLGEPLINEIKTKIGKVSNAENQTQKLEKPPLEQIRLTEDEKQEAWNKVAHVKNEKLQQSFYRLLLTIKKKNKIEENQSNT